MDAGGHTRCYHLFAVLATHLMTSLTPEDTARAILQVRV